MLYTEYITYKQIGQNPHTSFKQDTNGQSNQGPHHGPQGRGVQPTPEAMLNSCSIFYFWRC